jgi:thiamine biosynthesis lipoprotein
VGKSEVKLRIFGKLCHIIVEDQDGQGEQLLSICQEELKRLESRYSSYLPDSITSQINQGAGTGAFVPLDKEARSLFEYIDALWGESKHQFDPTTRILRDCYDNNHSLLASHDQLQGMLKLVGWRHIEINEDGAHMSNKGMLVDLNSCVRPYALDSVRKILLNHGVNSAFIELDRDVVTIGKQPDGANWMVGLRVPEGPRAAIYRLKLNDKGFAIRGNFEQAMVEDGEHFGSALSPVDGLAIPGLLSVAVIGDNCLTACSAASMARLKTEASGIKWLEKLGLPWIAVDRRLICHGPLAQKN